MNSHKVEGDITRDVSKDSSEHKCQALHLIELSVRLTIERGASMGLHSLVQISEPRIASVN